LYGNDGKPSAPITTGNFLITFRKYLSRGVDMQIFENKMLRKYLHLEGYYITWKFVVLTVCLVLLG
jgi:hypothetical protein